MFIQLSPGSNSRTMTRKEETQIESTSLATLHTELSVQEGQGELEFIGHRTREEQCLERAPCMGSPECVMTTSAPRGDPTRLGKSRFWGEEDYHTTTGWTIPRAYTGPRITQVPTSQSRHISNTRPSSKAPEESPFSNRNKLALE